MSPSSLPLSMQPQPGAAGGGWTGVRCKSEPQPHPWNLLQRLWTLNKVFPGSEATNRTRCRGEGQQREGSPGRSQEPISGKRAGRGPSLLWHQAPCLASGEPLGCWWAQGSCFPAAERPQRPSQWAGASPSARPPRATCPGRRSETRRGLWFPWHSVIDRQLNHVCLAFSGYSRRGGNGADEVTGSVMG